MKIKILLFIGLLMFFGNSNAKEKEVNKIANNDEAIEIVSSPELHGLAENLAKEYNLLKPDFNFRMNSGSTFSAASVEDNSTIVGFISGKTLSSSESAGLRKILVAREIVVPFINAANPFLKEIENQGISAEDFQNVLSNTDSKNWGALLGNNRRVPVQIYVNDQAESVVSGFLNVSAASVIKINSTEELLSELQKNIHAIGFCTLNSLTEPGTGELLSGVKLLPIDKNNNNKLDYNENIYNDLEYFKRGVWIGKYPRELVQNVYTVSSAKPLNAKTSAFLNWIITDGQQFVALNGLNELVYNERQAKLDKLVDTAELVQTSDIAFPVQKWVVLLVVFFAVVVSVAFFGGISRKSKAGKILSGRVKTIDENSLVFPNGLYFDKSHSWIFMEKDGRVKFGIDGFIPQVTGNFSRIILKNPGETVKRNEKILTLVQQGKQINIHAPVSGIIKDINETLVTNPEMVNNSPYDEGWVYLIQPSNWAREIRFYKLGGAYKEWIQSEFVRLKDFLACSFNIKNLSQNNLVFQEGGEITERVLQEMGPEIWEDFQVHFIDTTELY